MSLEQALADNTAALKELAAAMKAGGGAPATTGKTETKPDTKPKSNAGEHTKAEATAALNEVKEKFGTEKAVELRNKFGKVTKMADLSNAADIDALYKECKKAMEAGDSGSGGDGL